MRAQRDDGVEPAESTAAESAAAETTAADRTAAETTAADRTAADRTAADRTAAESAAAESAAAESAAADRTAAGATAAESGAAESTAAETTAAGTDPAALLALIAQQREATRRRTEPSLAVIATAWGGAWLIGYLVLYLTARSDGTPPPWAFGVFSAMLVLAIVVTAVHIGRRSRGITGESATVGAMYGWTWVIGFLVASLVFGGAVRAGASSEVMAVLTNGVSSLVVGLIYLAGGMLWREWRMFALGGWIAVIAGVASLTGTPALYLVMALAGGGGFLVAAAVDAWYKARRSG